MSTDLVFAQAALKDRMEWARAIAQAGDLVPAGFRNRDGTPNAAKILLAAETGAMLGLHPVAALNGIHVIEGKPTLSAGLMSALVRRAGHRLRVTTKGDVGKGTFEATAILIRADDPDFTYTATWNADRAKRAGLTGKGSWGKYFESMAKARAISEVIREGAEDVLMGAAYTPEEIGAVMTDSGELIREDLIEDAEVVEDAPAKAPKSAVKPATENEHAIADEWAARAARAITVMDARDLYREAKHRGLLGYPLTSGELLDDVLRARGEQLADEDAHTFAGPPSDEPLPVDDYPEPVF